MVQNRIGAHCPAFDLAAACSGFLFALETAAGFLSRGAYNRVLVVSAERMSGIIDWTDRGTCCIFGDGAGAAVLGKGDGLAGEDVALVIPHQANYRIINEARRRIPDIAPEKFCINIDRYGNTSSASVPILLDEMNRAGKIHEGDLIILAAFGGGLSAGAMIIRW